MVQTGKMNLLSAWKHIVSTDSVFIKIDSMRVGAFDDVDTTIESLCVSIAGECTDIRSATFIGNN